MRLVIISWLFLSPAAQAKPLSRKLGEVKKEILETRREISHYQKTETRLKKDVEFLKRKHLTNQKTLKRLKKLETSVRNKEQDLALQLKSLQEDSNFWSEELKRNIRAYFSDIETGQGYQSVDFLQQEQFLRFSLINDSSMLKALSGSAKRTAQDKQKTDAFKEGIIAQSQKAIAQSQKLSASFSREQSLIQNVAEKKAEALKREKKLEESEKALTLLLKKFNRRRKMRPIRKIYHPRPALGPHSLSWPARGKIVSFFGKEKKPELGTWVIHQGILLETSPHSPIHNVASGRVIFAGPFRSYGQIVIVDCGREFFAIYGHLGAILARTGETVEQGQTIGTSSSEPRLGNLYFELRQGTTALNPLGWLKK